MKKIISLVLAMVMVLAMGATAFADTFIGSVGPVGGLISARIIDANGNTLVPHKDLEDCLIVTHITETDKSHAEVINEISKLIEVYNKLVKGEMVLPYAQYGYDSDMVLVDLYDATFICEEHPEYIAPNGIRVELVLEANVAAGQEVCVMTYKNEKWAPIVSAVNNNDGTVTCVFEDFCPIAISVGDTTGVTVGGNEANPNTGAPLMLGAAAVLSAAAIVASKRK